MTALLHSKTDDVPIGHEEKKSEVIPPEPVISYDRKEEFPIAQALENTIGSSLISTPVISSRVRKTAHNLYMIGHVVYTVKIAFRCLFMIP